MRTNTGTSTVTLTWTASAGVVAHPYPTVLMSDSFNRANATQYSLGPADLSLGGATTYYYIPVFGGASITRRVGGVPFGRGLVRVRRGLVRLRRGLVGIRVGPLGGD